MTYRLCLIHPMDPRGAKVGGIETHIRLLTQRFPDDFSVMLVGVDARGDLEPGKAVKIKTGGREIDFLPVLHFTDEMAAEAATRITGSLTFRFTLALLRHYRAIRTLAGKGPVSADLQRFEFAPVAKLLSMPFMMEVHGEGGKDDKMDSLIKKHWRIYKMGEALGLRLATRALCVTPARVVSVSEDYPAVAKKIEFMSVSVDTDIFAPRPFDVSDDILRIVYAGRLDEFKDPPMMFSVIAGLRKALAGRVEFHYVGTTDPYRFEEFAEIEDVTIRHGFQDMQGVARIMSRAHAGILTSYFEGLPCFMMETLACGRPLGVLHLPQFEIRLPDYAPLIIEGKSGVMSQRLEDREETAARLVEKFMQLWRDIKAGNYDPQEVRGHVEPYSINVQLPRLFARHREMQAERFQGCRDTSSSTSSISVS